MADRTTPPPPNARALDFVRDRIGAMTGSCILHVHDGVIRKVEWREFTRVDDLPPGDGSCADADGRTTLNP